VLNFGDKSRIDAPFTNDIGVLKAGNSRVDAIDGTAVSDPVSAGEEYSSDTQNAIVKCSSDH
jgi:hypothetical protein